VFDTEDIEKGIRGVDFIYTDTWVRIGEPVERWRDRVTMLVPYRVDQELLARTENPDVKYLHNLPAVHDAQTTVGRQIYEETGLAAAEVADEVFKSDASIVFDQAENRMHAIKAVMVASLGTPDQHSTKLSVAP
jgi:ornithine carbamoyltransferase